jgi:hypothetical protein
LFFFLVSLLAFLHIFLFAVFSYFSCVLGLLVWSKIKIWRNIIPFSRGLATLVSSKIMMQCEGEFGTTRLIRKTQHGHIS